MKLRTSRPVHVIDQNQLPFSVIAREFVGDDNASVGVSLLFVDAPPGEGPKLHKHAYEEIFIVQEGQATFIAGDEEREVRAGEVVVVPADTPHRFVNSGDGPFRQIDIHVSPRFVTEWLEG
jgi:mannose-6-phosphate isomerase-like protein (cupin superfamily)